VIFFSCKTNARVYDAKLGHGPHFLPPGAAASAKRMEKIAYPYFTSETVWAQNPDSEPSKIYPSYN